jgi:Protein of unknown function (DUF2815).
MPATTLYANNGGKPTFNEFISPIGRVVHCYHDKPQLETDEKSQKPQLDADGIQKANFKVTLMWPKSELETTLIPLRTLAATTRDQAWGADCANDSWFRLESFMRDGDNPEHNTKRREYLMNHVYLNFKAKAIPIVKDGVFQKAYTGAPGLLGPSNEDLMSLDMYAGAWARVSGIMFGTEYMGKKFISIRLNNIQKGGGPKGTGDDERIGGGRPDAKSQFDPLMAKPDPFGGLGGGLGGGGGSRLIL